MNLLLCVITERNCSYILRLFIFILKPKLYETYFEDEIVTKICLTTDDKEASLELKELTALICPELNMLENA